MHYTPQEEDRIRAEIDAAKAERLSASAPSETACQPRSLALAPCSAPFSAWSDARGVWPRLTHEEIFRAGWDAAIAAAVSHVKGQALTPEEIEDGTKWADDATEHIAEAMRRSLLPNTTMSQPGGQTHE